MFNKIKVFLKALLKFFFIEISKLVLPIFFRKKYLQGRHFNNKTIGYIWAWRAILFQKILGINRHVPWPVSPLIIVGKNIEFNPDNLDNFQGFGNYFHDGITIGQGTYIACNVAIITKNHDVNNLDFHLPIKEVIIGKNCWIGINSVILPGVILGDKVIVGAGSVVTKSFSDGNCIIGGNPAKLIKKI